MNGKAFLDNANILISPATAYGARPLTPTETLIWDSQIVAAVERFGADALYSEDLGHGRTYGPVRCENAFREH